MAGSETLYRRGAAWYWRRRIPRRFSKFFTISTVRISTKGYLLTEARMMARAMNAVADIIFAALDDLGDVSDMHVARISDVAETLLREALTGILADAERTLRGILMAAPVRVPRIKEVRAQDWARLGTRRGRAGLCIDNGSIPERGVLVHAGVAGAVMSSRVCHRTVFAL